MVIYLRADTQQDVLSALSSAGMIRVLPRFMIVAKGVSFLDIGEIGADARWHANVMVDDIDQSVLSTLPTIPDPATPEYRFA